MFVARKAKLVTPVVIPELPDVMPANPVVHIGETFTLSIDTTGICVWRKNGVDIVGATGNTYTAVATLDDNEAVYQCYVFDYNLYRLSNPVTLTVLYAAVVITQQPVGGSISNDETLDLTVAATGDDAPSYQWMKDEVDIAGATDATYTVAGTAAGTFEYTCRVYNLVNTVVSTPAEVIYSIVVSPIGVRRSWL